MANIDLPASDEELKHHVTAPAHRENLLDYLEAFDYIRPLLPDQEGSLDACCFTMWPSKLLLKNVLYIEVRFAPELSMDQGLTVPETIDAVCDGLRQAQGNLALLQKPWSVACASQIKNSPLASLPEANQVRDQDFVGFDFAGDEHNYSPEDIRPLIEQVKVTIGR